MSQQSETPMTVEQILAEWEQQPGAVVSPDEKRFIGYMRECAKYGVGYGWMQQVIEWEWASKGIGSWGPSYFEKRIAELELSLRAKTAECEDAKQDIATMVKTSAILATENERLRASNERLTRENKILQAKTNNSLANNLCPDHRDKQQGKPCLACSNERLVKALEKIRDRLKGIKSGLTSTETKILEQSDAALAAAKEE